MGERAVGPEQQGKEEEEVVAVGGESRGPHDTLSRHHHSVSSSSSSFPSSPSCSSASFLSPLYENPPPSVRSIFNSVVKVYSDFTDPNYSLPWQMQRQGTSTGSGFVLKNRLIMTNAHCVSWNNRLQVRKHG